MTGLLLGIPDLVQHVKDNTHTSQWYLKGFWQLLPPDRRAFIVQASLVSRIAEGVDAELLEDSRVALRLPQLWAAANDELKWLIDVDKSVWVALAEVCEPLSADDLKDDVLRGAHVSYHFLWRRIFSRASMRPWSLVRGEVAENLKALAAEDEEPEEPKEPTRKDLANAAKSAKNGGEELEFFKRRQKQQRLSE